MTAGNQKTSQQRGSDSSVRRPSTPRGRHAHALSAGWVASQSPGRAARPMHVSNRHRHPKPLTRSRALARCALPVHHWQRHAHGAVGNHPRGRSKANRRRHYRYRRQPTPQTPALHRWVRLAVAHRAHLADSVCRRRPRLQREPIAVFAVAETTSGHRLVCPPLRTWTELLQAAHRRSKFSAVHIATGTCRPAAAASAPAVCDPPLQGISAPLIWWSSTLASLSEERGRAANGDGPCTAARAKAAVI